LAELWERAQDRRRETASTAGLGPSLLSKYLRNRATSITKPFREG
jgi:hypothetical protein